MRETLMFITGCVLAFVGAVRLELSHGGFLTFVLIYAGGGLISVYFYKRYHRHA